MREDLEKLEVNNCRYEKITLMSEDVFDKLDMCSYYYNNEGEFLVASGGKAWH